VTNVPDYGVEEVADTAMCFILGLLRRTFDSKEVMDNKKWETEIAMTKKAARVKGKTLGIVGLGKIGKAVAERAKPFGLHIQFYDPYVEDGIDKSLGITRKDRLAELLSTSDVVSLHCYLDDRNREMINKDSLKNIKKGAFLVNTARGGLINEDALVEALNDGRVAAAALVRDACIYFEIDGLKDVVGIEPYPKNGALHSCPNVILTPHTAFYSEEGWREMREKAAMEIKRVLDGGEPRNAVNKQYFKKKE